MNAILTSLSVLASIGAGVGIGMALRRLLPQHHLASESRDAMKQGMGLIATMVALLLGLLVASAKSSYDTQKSELTQMAAKIMIVDRLLAHYGPEAAECRKTLRTLLAGAIERIWSPAPPPRGARLDPRNGSDELYMRLQALPQRDDVQRALHGQITSAAQGLMETRWLMFEQSGSSISIPMLIMMTLWLTVVFISFGLFAPVNNTVIVTLLLCAVSVSGAVFLILEMDRPFDGILQISSQPLKMALEHLSR